MDNNTSDNSIQSEIDRLRERNAALREKMESLLLKMQNQQAQLDQFLIKVGLARHL
jgi:hypothetical protein